ncbi:hypothetical protein VPHK469_0156 [Vibrio phage K469]
MKKFDELVSQLRETLRMYPHRDIKISGCSSSSDNRSGACMMLGHTTSEVGMYLSRWTITAVYVAGRQSSVVVNHEPSGFHRTLRRRETVKDLVISLINDVDSKTTPTVHIPTPKWR